MKPSSDERTPDGGEHLAEHPQREQLLSTRIDERDEAVILAVEGEIDALTAPRFAEAIETAFERLGDRVLVLDLVTVRFLGSSGLRTLQQSAAEAARHRAAQQLRLVVDRSRPAIRSIEILGLDGLLVLYHSVEDALAADDLR